jgi:hypothetical protein
MRRVVAVTLMCFVAAACGDEDDAVSCSSTSTTGTQECEFTWSCDNDDELAIECVRDIDNTYDCNCIENSVLSDTFESPDLCSDDSKAVGAARSGCDWEVD